MLRSAMGSATRVLGLGRRIVPVALCALGAHAVIYASFLPSDGAHGYFRWYEPAVVGLGAAAVLMAAALALAALLGRGHRWTARLNAFLPERESEASLALRTARLAQAAVVFLFLQETLERSLSSGHLAPASFSASTWFLIVSSTAALALLLVLAGRASAVLIERVLAGHVRRVRARESRALRPRPVLLAPRRNPLADRRGLRAPPLLAG